MTTPPDTAVHPASDIDRPPGRRERRKEATRSALLAAAMRLFDEQGYRHVTVEDICAVADVSPRTFFRYFPAKDDLLLAPITELLDAVLTALRDRPAAESAWQALCAVVTDLAAGIDRDRDEVLRTWRVLQDSPETLGANARGLMEWDAAMSAQVAARMAVGPADQRPRLLTAMALGAFRVAFDAWGAADGDAPLVSRLADALRFVGEGRQDDAAPGPG